MNAHVDMWKENYYACATDNKVKNELWLIEVEYEL